MTEPKFNRFRISILTKLIIAFLIMMIPIYSVSLLMGNWGADLVKSQVSDSLASQSVNYLQSLSREMDRVIKLQREYVIDSDLERLSLGEDGLTAYEMASAMKRFQTRLRLIEESGIYVQGSQVAIFPLQRKISTSEVSTGLSPEETAAYAAEMPDTPGASPFNYKENVLTVRQYHPPFSVQSGRPPLFMLETTLSTVDIGRFLKDIAAPYPGSAAALFHRDWSLSTETEKRITGELELAARQYGGMDIGMEPQTGRMVIGEVPYLSVLVHEPSLGITLAMSVPESEVLGPIRRYRGFIWVMSALSVSVILIFSYSILRFLHRPLRQLIQAFRKVESGELNVLLQYRGNDEFRELYDRFNGMTSQLYKLVHEVYEQDMRAKQAELKQLQSQINPHFLYNSLYLLYRMIRAEDSDNALALSRYLGDYFRYITRKSGDEVLLEEEWEHVRTYTEIQSIRFSNRIRVNYGELPEAVKRLMVPRLILQPLVENAFEHGVERTVSAGELRVSAVSAEGEIRLTIEDGGPGMEEAELESLRRELVYSEGNGSGSGLINVHRRLRLKFGLRAGLSLASGEAGGLIATLHIPIPVAKNTILQGGEAE